MLYRLAAPSFRECNELAICVRLLRWPVVATLLQGARPTFSLPILTLEQANEEDGLRANSVEAAAGGVRVIKGPGGVPPGHDGVKRAPSSGGLFNKASLCQWAALLSVGSLWRQLRIAACQSHWL